MKIITKICIILAFLFFAKTSNAQYYNRQRVFGIGSSFGSGVEKGEYDPIVAYTLPTFDLKYFIPNSIVDINLVSPIINMLVASDIIGGINVWSDLYINISLGHTNTKFIVAPGLGFEYVDFSSNEGYAVRIPISFGFETLSQNQNFGFATMIRPVVSIGSIEGSFIIGYGAQAVVCLNGYITKN